MKSCMYCTFNVVFDVFVKYKIILRRSLFLTDVFISNMAWVGCLSTPILNALIKCREPIFYTIFVYFQWYFFSFFWNFFPIHWSCSMTWELSLVVLRDMKQKSTIIIRHRFKNICKYRSNDVHFMCVKTKFIYTITFR